jgi:hypothetical protein
MPTARRATRERIDTRGAMMTDAYGRWLTGEFGEWFDIEFGGEGPFCREEMEAAFKAGYDKGLADG